MLTKSKQKCKLIHQSYRGTSFSLNTDLLINVLPSFYCIRRENLPLSFAVNFKLLLKNKVLIFKVYYLCNSWNHTISNLFNGLLSHCNMLLGFCGLGTHFFLVVNNIPLQEKTCLFTYSPTEGHLSYFQVLGITNKVAININVQLFMWTYVFSSFG